MKNIKMISKHIKLNNTLFRGFIMTSMNYEVKVKPLRHVIIHCPEEGEGNNVVILLHVCLMTKDLTYTEN